MEAELTVAIEADIVERAIIELEELDEPTQQRQADVAVGSSSHTQELAKGSPGELEGQQAAVQAPCTKGLPIDGADVEDAVTDISLLLRIALPSTLSLLLLAASQTITMAYVGHRLGFTKFAQFSVALAIFNIAGAAPGIGAGGALDTYASQSYGKNKHTDLTPLFHRGMLLNLVLLLPCGFTFVFCEPLLVVIYGEHLAIGAAELLRSCVVYLLLIWNTNNITRILAAQHLAAMGLYGNAVGTGAAFIFGSFLKQGASLTEVAMLLTLIQATVSVVLWAICSFHKRSLLQGWWKIHLLFPVVGGGGETVDSTRNTDPPTDGQNATPGAAAAVISIWNVDLLKEHGLLAMHSLIAVCGGWWAFELLQVLAAQLGELEVASFTVLINIMALYFSIGCGISIGGGTLVGNALGSGRPKLARKYAILTAKISAVAVGCTVLSLFAAGQQLFSLYTTDVVALDLLVSMIPFLAVWHLLDFVQTVMNQGLFRGAAKQHRSGPILMFSLWCVGLPFAALFGLYFQWGLRGVLTGQMLGVAMLCVLLLRGMITWDWDELARQAAIRNADASAAAVVANTPSDDLGADGSDLGASGGRGFLGTTNAAAVEQLQLEESTHVEVTLDLPPS